MTAATVRPGADEATALDRLWAAASDLDLIMTQHGGNGGPDYGKAPAAGVVFLMEVPFYSHRNLAHLIMSGVFERFPTLRYVMTEQGVAWLVEELRRMDGYHRQMLHGRVGSNEDRGDHMLKRRDLQDDTGGFTNCLPLAFPPENTQMDDIPSTGGMLDIRNYAVGRLLLDNMPHIKAYWIMMTPKIAQVAQRFGADDIDGTVVEEKIYHDAGAKTPQVLRREQLLRLIRSSGREPTERDTLYREVRRDEATLALAV